MTNKEKVKLVPYSPMWKEYYLKECRNLETLLKANFIEAYHIGSTAVKSILARPVLDILCVVHTLDGIEAFQYEFEKIGLILKDQDNQKEQINFTRFTKDKITVISDIYIHDKSSSLIQDHLDFRDYLNKNQEVAQEYQQLKIEHQNKDIKIYTQVKGDFIQATLDKTRSI